MRRFSAAGQSGWIRKSDGERHACNSHGRHAAIDEARFVRAFEAEIASTAERVPDRTVTSIVRFKRLSEAETEDYIACGEWHGKAGGYAIQGRAASFVSFIAGSYSNVVGLPLFETVQLLEAHP